MSGVNGYQICGLLKYDIKYEDILVVILSEGDGNKYQQLANNSGADGILGKPININELIGCSGNSRKYHNFLFSVINNIGDMQHTFRSSK